MSTTNIGGFFRASERASSPVKDGASPEKPRGSKSLAAPQPSGGNARSGGRSSPSLRAGAVPAGGGQQAAARKEKAMVARAASRQRMEEVDDVDLYGRKAGPPGRPVVSDLEPASCLLRWEPPRHTGGRDVPIIGHYITVQFAWFGQGYG